MPFARCYKKKHVYSSVAPTGMHAHRDQTKNLHDRRLACASFNSTYLCIFFFFLHRTHATFRCLTASTTRARTRESVSRPITINNSRPKLDTPLPFFRIVRLTTPKKTEPKQGVQRRRARGRHERLASRPPRPPHPIPPQPNPFPDSCSKQPTTSQAVTADGRVPGCR